MSIIINGKKLEIPGLITKSWLDGISWVKEITDFNQRARAIRFIVAHTHIGKKGKLLPGMGPGTSTAEALVRYQTNTTRQVSWDFSIDNNAVVYVQNDPVKKYSWQAGRVNPISLGFEMVQTSDGDVYEGQIEAVVLLVDVLTALLGIQRQILWNSKTGAPKQGVVERLKNGGDDVVGLVGHRNITPDRGPGDPGDFIFLALKKAGYEVFDLDLEEDKTTWKARQKALGFKDDDCDGLPLGDTVNALKKAGKKHGMWVKRPIDDLLP